MLPRQSFFSLDQEQTSSEDVSRNPFARSGIDPTLSPEFDNLVTAATEFWHVPGLAIAVIDRKHISCQGYGVARLRDEDETSVGTEQEDEQNLVTPKTLFDIASMSKSFTAAAMALLVQDDTDELKNVNWQTPVSRLCSDFMFENDFATQNISVEDILSHRSGLPSHDEALRGIFSRTPDNPASVTQNLRNLSFSRPLRTEFQYSNTLYTTASHLVSTLSRTNFDEFLKTRFWTPLEMTRTCLGPDTIPESEMPSLAQGYVWLTERRHFEAIPHTPEPERIGAGSIISSVEDIARWICAYLYHSPPLSESSYAALATPRILEQFNPKAPFLSPSFYALGWEVSYYHGHTIIQHGGLWAGCSSKMLYIPSRKWGFVMMGNSESFSEASVELGWHLVDEVLGIPAEERFAWRDHLIQEQEKYTREDSKEDLYPELNDYGQDVTKSSNPELERFVGTYRNPGYHELELRWREDDNCLEADCSDRSYSFLIQINEHVYDYWFVAAKIDTVTGDRRTMRCQFEVNGEECVRVGLMICEELNDMIWFEKI